MSSYIAKPLITGGIGAAAAAALFGTKSSVDTPFGAMNLPLTAFIAFGGAEELSNVLAQYFFPSLHMRAFGAWSSELANIGLIAGAAAGVMYLANPELISSFGMWQLLAVAAVATVGTDYLYDHWVQPMLV